MAAMETDPPGPSGAPGKEVQVWLRVNEENRQAIYVKVSPGAYVLDAMKTALREEKLDDIAPGLVIVKFHDEEVDTEALIKDELDRGHGNRKANCFLLELPEDNGQPRCKKQKIAAHASITKSPSAFANCSSTELNEHVHQSPLYSHWFAMEIYDHFCRLKNAPAADTVAVTLQKRVCNIPRDVVSTVVEEFKTISAFHSSSIPQGVIGDEELRTAEQTKSAMFARSLDRFLFRDDQKSKGACCHQLPVFRQAQGVQSPDMFVVQLRENCPCTPVLLSDIKNEGGEKSRKETWAYCIKAMKLLEKGEWGLLLGLAISEEKAELYVVIDNDGYVLAIDVCSVYLSRDEARSFFAVLYAAVHSLIDYPLSMNAPGIEPMNGYQGKALDQGRNAHVFRSGNTVSKFYDTQFVKNVKPNLEAIHSICENYIPNIQLLPLTNDKRALCLKYAYIKGSHTPCSVKQFATILKDLEKLHNKGYVHGDMRKENLVFSATDDTAAWIIDFDLAGKVGSRYPSNYNHCNIEERHTSAKANLERQKVHDTYALCKILQNFFSVSTKVIESLEQTPLKYDCISL